MTVNINTQLRLNTLDLDIFLIINDQTNVISSAEREILIHTYTHFKDIIINGLKNKTMASDINTIFWLNNLVHMMIYLEARVNSGIIRKHIILEIIALIIKNDTTYTLQEKVQLNDKIRVELSNIIDLYAFASKNINVKQSKSVFKLFN